MPLETLVGVGKTTECTRSPTEWSNSMYSPRLGVMVKLSSPAIRATSPEWTPAALTTKGVSMRPSVVCNGRRPVADHFDAGDLALGDDAGTVADGVLGEGDRRRERADDRGRRRPQGAHDIWRKIGLVCEHLVAAPQRKAGHSVFDATAAKLFERGALRFVERHDQGADPAPRDAEVLADRLVEVRAAHVQARLPGARLGVEAGVQDPAVGLRRAHGDVGRALEQDDGQGIAGQFARNRAPDHAAANHHDVRLFRKSSHGRRAQACQFLFDSGWLCQPQADCPDRGEVDFGKTPVFDFSIEYCHFSTGPKT